MLQQVGAAGFSVVMLCAVFGISPAAVQPSNGPAPLGPASPPAALSTRAASAVAPAATPRAMPPVTPTPTPATRKKSDTGITVTPATLTFSDIGQSGSFIVNGGTPPYTVAPGNTKVATVNPLTAVSAPATFTVLSVGSGTAQISVSSGGGSVGSVTVTVTTPTPTASPTPSPTPTAAPTASPPVVVQGITAASAGTALVIAAVGGGTGLAAIIGAFKGSAAPAASSKPASTVAVKSGLGSNPATSDTSPITLTLSDSAKKSASLQATQNGFNGGEYTAGVQCSPVDAATVDTPKSKDGKFTVTAKAAGTCAVTITGGDNTTGTLTVSIVP